MVNEQKHQNSILERFEKKGDKFFFQPGEEFQLKKTTGELVPCIMSEAYIQYASSSFKNRLFKYIPPNINVVVAGGSVSDFFFHGNFAEIRDFDFFPCSERDREILETHLDKLFLQMGENLDNKTVNTFSKKYKFSSIEIDVVKMLEPTVEKAVQRFDFNVCKFGFAVHENWRFYKDCFWEHLFNRRFEIKSYKDEPLVLLKRVLRYYKKGYSLSPKDLAMFYSKLVTVNQPEKFEDEFKKQSANINSSHYEFLGGDAEEVIVTTPEKKRTNGFTTLFGLKNLYKKLVK